MKSATKLTFLVLLLFTSACDNKMNFDQCKEKLSSPRPYGDHHISEIGDCIYDFYAFISRGDVSEIKGIIGKKKKCKSFIERHMELYREMRLKELKKKYPPKTEFNKRFIKRDLEKDVSEMKATINSYILVNKKRYFVHKVRVTFNLENRCDFIERKLHIQAKLETIDKVKVFWGRAEIKINGPSYEFGIPMTMDDANRLLSSHTSKSFEIKRKFYIKPFTQGVCAPYWIFRDKNSNWLLENRKKEVVVRMRVHPGFERQVEAMIKKWVQDRLEK